MNKQQHDFQSAVHQIDVLIDPLIQSLIQEHKHQVTNDQYIQSYTVVHHVFNNHDHHNSSQKVEHQFIQYFQDKMTNFANQLLSKMQDQSDRLFKVFNQLTKDYLLVLKWFQNILHQIDNYYLKYQNRNLVEIAHNVFREHFVTVLIEQLRQKMIDRMEQLHCNETSIEQCDDLQLCIDYLYQMGFTTDININARQAKFSGSFKTRNQYYIENVESMIIEQKKKYYDSKKKKMMIDQNTMEYINSLNAMIESEHVLKQLYSYSSDVIDHLINQVFIIQESRWLINTNIIQVFQRNDIDELKLVYSIFKRVDSCLQMTTVVYKLYLEYEIDSIFQSTTDPNERIANVIRLYSQTEQMNQQVYDKQVEMIQSRDMAFKHKINQISDFIINMNQFIDYQFRKGYQKQDEHGIDKELKLIVNLFNLIYNKDVFLRVYEKMLGKRLIYGTSVNSQMDSRMIEYFQSECGISNITKLIKMEQDIQSSQNQVKQFKDDNDQNDGVVFNIKVLTKSLWSLEYQKIDGFEWPEPMNKLVCQYNEYYHQKNPNRVVKFMLTEGYGIIKYKEYEIVCSTIQMVILHWLHSRKKMKNYELDISFRKGVKNLVEVGVVVQDKDEIELNSEFMSKTKKISAILRQSESEECRQRESVDGQVESQRKMMVDSSIIRLMKSNKEMKMSVMMEQVVKQTDDFRVENVWVKKRIENLMDRGYIQRHETDKSVLVYVA